MAIAEIDRKPGTDVQAGKIKQSGDNGINSSTVQEAPRPILLSVGEQIAVFLSNNQPTLEDQVRIREEYLPRVLESRKEMLNLKDNIPWKRNGGIDSALVCANGMLLQEELDRLNWKGALSLWAVEKMHGKSVISSDKIIK